MMHKFLCSRLLIVVLAISNQASAQIANVPYGTTTASAATGNDDGIIGAVRASGGMITVPLIVGPAVSPVVDLYSSPPKTYVGASPGGARLSIAPIGGHALGDSIRTQFGVETVSGTDASIEETASIFEISSGSSYARPWYTSTSYPAATQIHGNDGAIFINARLCHSGLGPAPSGITSGQSDGPGGCAWNYVGIGAGDGKSAQLLTTNIYGPAHGLPGGGQGWGQGIIMGVQGGAWPYGGGFGVGQEIDVGNSAHDCPPGVTNGCSILGSFINGNGLHRSSIATFIGGSVGFHVGIQLSSNAASDTSFADAANSQTGILENGTKGIASYRDASRSPTATSYEGSYSNFGIKDTSTSPTFAYVHGTHSFAGFLDDVSANAFRSTGMHSGASFLDQATTPYGLRLIGTYVVSQISGAGFSVDPAGKETNAGLTVTGSASLAGTLTIGQAAKLPAYTVATLPTCNTAAQDEIVIVSDAKAPTYRGALTGSGSVRTMSECDGSSWTAH